MSGHISYIPRFSCPLRAMLCRWWRFRRERFLQRVATCRSCISGNDEQAVRRNARDGHYWIRASLVACLHIGVRRIIMFDRHLAGEVLRIVDVFSAFIASPDCAASSGVDFITVDISHPREGMATKDTTNKASHPTPCGAADFKGEYFHGVDGLFAFCSIISAQTASMSSPFLLAGSNARVSRRVSYPNCGASRS